MSLCSSCKEGSYHMQRPPGRRKDDHPPTLSQLGDKRQIELILNTHCTQQSHTRADGDQSRNNAEFPSLQSRTIISHQCCNCSTDKAVCLLYLAIDHYIKANAVDFIQGAEALASLIHVVAGKSAKRQISWSQVSVATVKWGKVTKDFL